MAQNSMEDKSEIREFYEGKSVFVTGASGYVGGILLEHLLRLCPGIAEIYILLRERKGRSPTERKDQIFDKPYFWKVKRDTPEALQKVHVISGQLQDDELGISPENLEKLKRNVSIVFHCAASVSFKRDTKYMLINNVLGTYNVISLSKKLPKLAVFVYTSTAFSYGKEEEIKEDIFPLPVPVNKIIEAVRSQDDKFLQTLDKEHVRKWINNYTFSKCAAESLVAENAEDMAVAIVRPPVISHVWKGSLPGYIEHGSTFADAIYGVTTGFLQILLMNENGIYETIPCDIIANTLIATTWSIATKRVDIPVVINCTSSNTVPLTYGQLYNQFIEHPYSFINNNTFRIPSITYVSSPLMYKLLSFFVCHLPAYIGDVIIWFCGGKLSVKKLYEIVDDNSLSASKFTLRKYFFETTNFNTVKSLLNKSDSEIFNIDLTGYNFRYIADNCAVNPGFQFKLDNNNERKCKQVVIADRVAMLVLVYKYFLLVVLLTMVSVLFKIIFRSLM